MKNFKLRTRYRNIEVVKYSDIAQVILTSSVCGQLNLEVFNLSSTHYEKLVSYTSLPLLLAYAKRNQIPASICLADDHQDIRQCSNCEHDDANFQASIGDSDFSCDKNTAIKYCESLELIGDEDALVNNKKCSKTITIPPKSDK